MNALPHEKQVAVVVQLICGKSARSAARAVKVNKLTVFRLRRLWLAGAIPSVTTAAQAAVAAISEAQVVAAPEKLPRGVVEWEGRCIRLVALCAEIGVSYSRTLARLAKGASLAEALHKEHGNAGLRRVEIDFVTVEKLLREGNSCRTVAKALGLRPSIVTRRINEVPALRDLVQYGKSDGRAGRDRYELFGEVLSLSDLAELSGQLAKRIRARLRRGSMLLEALGISPAGTS